MDWDKLKKEQRKRKRVLSLKQFGFTVFEIVQVYDSHEVINDNKNNKFYDEPTRYYMREMDIRLKFHINREYDNELRSIRLSDSVWQNIIDVKSQLDYYHVPEPKYLIYWKRNKISVQVAFITEQQYNNLLNILGEYTCDDRFMSQKIHDGLSWTGGSVRSSLKKFKEWYGVDEIIITEVE